MFVEIEKVLIEKESAYAHMDRENKSRKETLEEHTKLCQDYFLKINQAKTMDSVLDVVWEENFADVDCGEQHFFVEMFYNVVTFHDMGKCNPLFQFKKMKHKTFPPEEFQAFGTNHSLLSAAVYIQYFFEKLKKIRETLSQEGYKILCYFIVLNAYVIARHHSGLGNLEDFLEGFYEEAEEGIYETIEVLWEADHKIIVPEIEIAPEEVCILATGTKRKIKDQTIEQSVVNYTYERLLYSVLTASDYYATTEFMSGIKTTDFGNIQDLEEFEKEYENGKIIKSIRKYEKEVYGRNKNSAKEEDICRLRNELFLDAEKEWEKNKGETVFFLEAPTGSGKSNVGINLSFRCAKENNLGKIFYVYPFNTLVEQNKKTLEDIFQNKMSLLDQVAVVNSVVPIQCEKIRKEGKGDGEAESTEDVYRKALLDRQFLNYPIVLTTNISLFRYMFGREQKDAFGFYQLMNSTVILDEIQNYKNLLWTEIITFLQTFAKVLHMKIIIMSATLPDLNRLLPAKTPTVRLIGDREKYYLNPVFRNRTIQNFDLLSSKNIDEDLLYHVLEQCRQKKKILMEFITKKSAERFYYNLKEKLRENLNNIEVQLMTGDDDEAERKRILHMTQEDRIKENGMVLVGTQVVEAGLDIDMDIGYKNISMLDSEEQFLGRINRSCRQKSGIVYFFQMDEARAVYDNDYRINKELTLFSEEMREILKEKSFSVYYDKILHFIKTQNDKKNKQNTEDFFQNVVGKLNFGEIEERMKLIRDDKYNISVFLARERKDLEGNPLSGKEVWSNYEKLLKDSQMPYPEKVIKLSEIKSKMNYFIYQIRRDSNLVYNQQIGELYYIEDGEKFFQDGKLVRERIEEAGGLFVD